MAAGERTRPGRLVVREVREADRELQDALQVCEPHLRSSCAHVATVQNPRCRRTTGQRVPGKVLMDVAWDLLRDGSFGQHCDLSGHISQSRLAGTIQKRSLPSCTVPLVPEPLSTRAMVDVVGRVISKIAAREGAVVSLRFVEYGNMWRDTLPPRVASSASERLPAP